MKKLTPDQLKEYLENLLVNDAKVRKWCDIPDDKYYSVSVWPENVTGNVWMDDRRFRTVHSSKISKSDV